MGAIGLAGGINFYGFASGDPLNVSDPSALKVCFGGSRFSRRRLADSTAVATQTAFDLDDDGCATNVEPAGDAHTDVGSGFAALAAADYMVRVVYDAGPSRVVGKIRINPDQIDRPYGVFRVSATRRISTPGAVWDEPSILAHEFGHAYAQLELHLPRDAENNRVAIRWENTVHSRRGRPLRSFSCH